MYASEYMLELLNHPWRSSGRAGTSQDRELNGRAWPRDRVWSYDAATLYSSTPWPSADGAHHAAHNRRLVEDLCGTRLDNELRATYIIHGYWKEELSLKKIYEIWEKMNELGN